MPTNLEDIEDFINRRKAGWTERFRADPAKAATLLRRYGKAGLLDSVTAGAKQGVLHGWGDEAERAGRKDKTARKQILAQASHPKAYLASQLAGLGITGLLLRGVGGGVGRARAGKIRSQRSPSAGMQEQNKRIEARADKVERDWSAFPLPKSDPRARALIMDAGHGAALGAGGSDPTAAETSTADRLKHGGIGLLLTSLGAPLSTSAAVAAANSPLLFGGRRIGSRKMLEPPGVTKATPEGRPREAIDIARSKDEALARGQGEGSAMVRDTTPPMQSSRPNTQQLADQAIEPIAAQRIDELARQERAAASDAIAAAYPDKRGSRRQQEPDAIPAPQRSGPDEETFRYVVGDGRARLTPLVLKMMMEGANDKAIARALGVSRGSYRRSLERLMQEDPATLAAVTRARGVSRGEDPGFWKFADEITRRDTAEQARLQAPVDRVVERFNAGRTPGPARPTIPDATLNAMLEPVVRRDRHAFESWSSRIEAMNRRDPTVLPRLQGAVAAMLARTERRSGGGHRMNDDPTTQLYLRTLGMTGNRTKGTQNVIEAARGPAAERFNSRRFQDAQARTAGGPRMRSRHAEALRHEMAAYRAPEYQGPPVGTMREPLVARGDDRPYWLSPTDFLRRDKFDHAHANMAGGVSGPLAFGLEQFYKGAVEPPGEWREEPIEAEFEDIQPRGTLAAIAGPQAPRNAVMQAAAAQNEPITLRQAQQVMIERAGIPLSRFGPDGIMGPETETALRTFQQAAGIPATGELDDMTQARLRQYRDGLLPDVMQREIDTALGALGK